MGAKIIGNKKALFGVHGDIGVEKVLEAIEYMTEAEEININELNKASENGLIYITASGQILDGVSKTEEGRAKYKITPTGLKLRYTEYPLFASFIKMNGYWEGAFVGTGVQLFEMYRDHYGGGRDNYSTQFETVFGGDNRTLDIRGFGLKEVLENKDKEIYYEDTSEEESSHASELAKALERCKKKIENETKANSKYRKTAKYSKAMKKAAKLEAHLNRLQSNNKETKNIKANKTTKSDKNNVLKTCYNSIDEITWLEIFEIGEVKEYFEDTATKEFNKRIADSIGSEYSDKAFDEVEPIVSDTVTIENTEEHIEYEENKPIIENIETYDKKEDANDCKLESESEFDESDDIDEDILKSMDHDLDNAEKDKYKSQLKADLVSDIYERLLIKENWRANSKNRLAFYLKGLFIVVDTNRKHNKGIIKGNGYTLSKDYQKQVVNTGLIDKYGNYIYLVDHTPRVQDFYSKKIVLLLNKASLLDWGFELKDIKQLPSPIKFVNNNSEFMFRGSLDDFDLNDEYHLKHIIDERRARLPYKYRNESAKVLCDKLKTAIEQAVRLSKTDYKYIIPKYDFARNSIQFLIPFHLDTNLDEQAELAIVIGNCNGIWQVYTILHSDDAYDDARLICKPSSDWLKVNK